MHIILKETRNQDKVVADILFYLSPRIYIKSVQVLVRKTMYTSNETSLLTP